MILNFIKKAVNFGDNDESKKPNNEKSLPMAADNDLKDNVYGNFFSYLHTHFVPSFSIK